jgi:hypothetical protein
VGSKKIFRKRRDVGRIIFGGISDDGRISIKRMALKRMSCMDDG